MAPAVRVLRDGSLDEADHATELLGKRQLFRALLLLLTAISGVMDHQTNLTGKSTLTVMDAGYEVWEEAAASSEHYQR